MGFASECRICHGRCDPGELRNGICFECTLEQRKKEKVRQKVDRMVRADKYEQLEIESSQQAAKHQMIKDYINTLKKQNKPLTKFDGLMWGSLLESATIIDKDTIVFKFKDGTEING